jgi:hypothetical protein
VIIEPKQVQLLPLSIPISPDALKDRRRILDRWGDDVDASLRGWNDFAV